jgi:hypothetical protein
MATYVDVAVSEIVAVGDGEGVSVGDMTPRAGVLAPHATVSKPSPTRRFTDHRWHIIMRASMFSPSSN